MSNRVTDNQLHPITAPWSVSHVHVAMRHTYMAILYELTRPKKVFVFSNGKKNVG